MFELLWLVPVIPLLGFAALTVLSGSGITRRDIAWIGVGSVGLSALLTAWIAINFILSPPPDHTYTQVLWVWMNVAGFSPRMAFQLDDLSLVFMLVITWVGLLIHLYSAEFMQDEEGYARFFSYMNLFIGMMLILVLADNLLLLYLGWEGVGLCSFLLIGFWYHDPANGRAARKAFIVTRIGDTAMAVGLFLLFDQLGTLQIQEMMGKAALSWQVGAPQAILAAALLLGGAIGKSAQIPLQIWLPDAMAGPSPVSALIHAATMVTAGVYLIARTHVLFTLAPPVMLAVAVIGALTLLLAGLSALAQRDIKRVLAYSTISQIGYMFLALGVGAWSAAIFHFMTHAFFKALLFLAAGVIIMRLHHEHDMFKMGGLRKQMPVVFWTFLIGACSLSALPLVTAGFYSKDQILWEVWSSAHGGPWLWAAGLVGAFLTSVYTFRMVFLTFFGEPKPLVEEMSPLPAPGWRMAIPLLVLALLSVVGGFINLPETMGGLPILQNFLHNTLPPPALKPYTLSMEDTFQIIAAATSLFGILVAYVFILRIPQVTARVTHSRFGSLVQRWWYYGLGFDWVDNNLLVAPFVATARFGKDDLVDTIFDGVGWINIQLNGVFSDTQTGLVRTYLLGIVFGAIVAVALVVLL